MGLEEQQDTLLLRTRYVCNLQGAVREDEQECSILGSPSVLRLGKGMALLRISQLVRSSWHAFMTALLIFVDSVEGLQSILPVRSRYVFREGSESCEAAQCSATAVCKQFTIVGQMICY